MPWETIRRVPFIRGIFNFVDSAALGFKALMFSASFFEEETETDAEELSEQEVKKQERKEKLLMNLTLAVSFVLAIGIFMILPYFLSNFVQKVVTSRWVNPRFWRVGSVC